MELQTNSKFGIESSSCDSILIVPEKRSDDIFINHNITINRFSLKNSRNHDFSDAKSFDPVELKPQYTNPNFNIKQRDDISAIRQLTLANVNSYVYKTNFSVKRLAIIYNNSYFMDYKDFKNLDSNEQDVKRLKEVLLQLNYEIIVYNDLTKLQLIDSATEIRILHKKQLEASDSIMVIILTYGLGGSILMARNRPYDLYDLMEKFSPEFIPALASKPKLFFIQACRGHNNTYNIDGMQKLNLIDDDHYLSHPRFTDVLTTFYSYYENRGYSLTTEFCEIIEHYKTTNDLGKIDLAEIMMIICNHITLFQSDIPESEYKIAELGKYMPVISSTLIKKFYFK